MHFATPLATICAVFFSTLLANPITSITESHIAQEERGALTTVSTGVVGLGLGLGLYSYLNRCEEEKEDVEAEHFKDIFKTTLETFKANAISTLKKDTEDTKNQLNSAYTTIQKKIFPDTPAPQIISEKLYILLNRLATPQTAVSLLAGGAFIYLIGPPNTAVLLLTFATTQRKKLFWLSTILLGPKKMLSLGWRGSKFLISAASYSNIVPAPFNTSKATVTSVVNRIRELFTKLFKS
jgi:hypothetical protein